MSGPVIAPVSTARGPRAWLSHQGGGLPRAFWVVWIGTVINRLGYVVEPFLALYLVHGRGITVSTAGLLIACFGAGAFVSQPLGGTLADRIGRRFTIILGMTGSAAGFIALGLAPNIAVIGIAAAICGLAIDVYRPAVAALVADVVPTADRPRAYGLLYPGLNIGVGVAAVAGGFLAQQGRVFGRGRQRVVSVQRLPEQSPEQSLSRLIDTDCHIEGSPSGGPSRVSASVPQTRAAVNGAVAAGDFARAKRATISSGAMGRLMRYPCNSVQCRVVR
jgi:Major Facilitator Superfamily